MYICQESMTFIQGPYPGSSPVFQLHLIHEDVRDIRLRKLRLSEPPGDLSTLCLRECIFELALLDLGVLDLGGVDIGVLDLGGVAVGVVDLGGVEVGVVDCGGVLFGVVDWGGVPFGVVDFDLLAFGLFDRLQGLLPQRDQRVLLDCREFGLLGRYAFCG